MYKYLLSLISILFILSACRLNISDDDAKESQRVKYVSLGSSFAAGPGVKDVADNSPDNCWQSDQNYARKLSQRLNLHLIDGSCIGAKLSDIASPISIYSQMENIQSDTGLVTLLAGGNDLGYLARLMTASCENLVKQGKVHKTIPCLEMPEFPDIVDYENTEYHLNIITNAIIEKAPNAVIVLIDYATVLPLTPLCDLTPMDTKYAIESNYIKGQLEGMLERVSTRNGTLLIKASEITRDHNVCSEEPWIRDYKSAEWGMTTLPYHPTYEYMLAITDALEDVLKPYF
ncbi:MAG: SGNH/GDSL hydrolase family protein [Hellea sp.]|nr:SGNH/GDSL hydrolase family protein [Hellea sp.]